MINVALALFGALAVTAPTVAALAVIDNAMFVLFSASFLMQSRMDPIVNPGEVASHVHSVMGASNFRSVLNTPEEQQRATCSSVVVQADKSSYWAPALYFINDKNEYEHMTGGARIYYFGSGAETQPWPKGMRIISGNAMKRDRWLLESQGMAFDGDETGNSQFYLPNGTSHPHGTGSIHMGIHFPSCGWANQSLDSWDHFSHLTWPIQAGGGNVWINVREKKCPPSHPIKYPVMFLQTNYYPSARQQKMWRSGDNVNVILSNGDTLGTSFHADFVSGWDEGVLQEAIRTCNVGDKLQNCPPLAPSLDAKLAANCRYQGMIPDEEAGHLKAMKDLPGCNPRWDRDGGDVKPRNCPASKTPGWTGPNVWWASRTRGVGLPLAVSLPAEAAGMTDLSQFANTEERDAMYRWGSSGQYLNWPTSDVWTVGTDQDIADNLDMSTAKNKIDTSNGVQDTSTYDSITKSGAIAPESVWMDLKTIPANQNYTSFPNEPLDHRRPDIYRGPELHCPPGHPDPLPALGQDSAQDSSAAPAAGSAAGSATDSAAAGATASAAAAGSKDSAAAAGSAAGSATDSAASNTASVPAANLAVEPAGKKAAASASVAAVVGPSGDLAVPVPPVSASADPSAAASAASGAASVAATPAAAASAGAASGSAAAPTSANSAPAAAAGTTTAASGAATGAVTGTKPNKKCKAKAYRRSRSRLH